MKTTKNQMLTADQVNTFLASMPYQVELDGYAGTAVYHLTEEVQGGDAAGGTEGEVLAVYDRYNPDSDEYLGCLWLTEKLEVHGVANSCEWFDKAKVRVTRQDSV